MDANGLLKHMLRVNKILTCIIILGMGVNILLTVLGVSHFMEPVILGIGA